jgi:lipid-A-disaccharide synthase-like uncharacterized protein
VRIGCLRTLRFTRILPVAHDGSIMSMSIETIWLAIGFLGQGLFFGRWVVQWIASEKKAESQVPISFWYMSLIGGLITLAYAIYREDPVFIAGQSIGSIVYIRNLMLISRASQANPPVSPTSPRT